MPAIDLARLRKQANRLVDFFFLPDEFMKHLREMLEFYVNHTLRTREDVAPGSNLKTYRTPSAVLTQIENELRAVAEANPEFALELADTLWDDGALETRLLAAFLLGRIPPQEERLLPRLTAWTQQVRDPDVRSALLSTSLTRMRKENPNQFLTLIREYLHPARMRTWSNGIQALLPMISDATNANLPSIFDLIEPIVEESPATLQNDLRDVIVALYRASPNETTFLLKHILTKTHNPMTAITLRRIAVSFPPALQDELRDLLRAKSFAPPKTVNMDDLIDKIFAVDGIEKAEAAPNKKSARLSILYKKSNPARSDAKTKQGNMDNAKIIYLHGLESTSQSGKARQFAEKFPGMVTPDFTGSFEERMKQLKPILGRRKNWIIIGSSYGGLMGTVFTCQHPEQVRKLILLAPALLRDPLGAYLDPATGKYLVYLKKSKYSLQTTSVSAIVVHGTEDDVVPLVPVRKTAETLFSNLTYHVVNDGHRLHKAFEELDWEEITSS